MSCEIKEACEWCEILGSSIGEDEERVEDVVLKEEVKVFVVEVVVEEEADNDSDFFLTFVCFGSYNFFKVLFDTPTEVLEEGKGAVCFGLNRIKTAKRASLAAWNGWGTERLATNNLSNEHRNK